MQVVEHQTRRWTREEYHQMGDLGFFQDQRVELIDGEILHMAPQRDMHFAGVSLVGKALERVFGDGYWVRLQGPLALSDDTEPEPDVAVVRGGMRDYIGNGHPRGALLVVEVSDTTLRLDRGSKASLYARHGILDYWIVNLADNYVEVYREPAVDSAARFGYRYGSSTIFQKGQSINPLAMPGSLVKVDDLLP